MALTRLASMPAELKLETYYHLDFSDLLALSHVSRFWRAFVLGDRRWSTWFDMVVNPETKERVEKILSRLQSTNTIPARTIVNLCFSTKCSICSAETADLFLPLLKRVCHACLDPEEHAVISLSAGLTAFDLNEKDITPDIVILQCDATHSRNTFTKLVSKSAMHALAIKKYGGPTNLATHLQARKARSQQAYDARIAEYDAATTRRDQLVASGDLVGAAAVTLKTNSKKIPKTRPQPPPILKPPYAPRAYQAQSIIKTNFLSVQDGSVVAQSLVYCYMCLLMAEVRGAGHPDPDPMKPAVLPRHEQQAHYAHLYDQCLGPEVDGADGICDACLNREAVAFKAEMDSVASASSSWWVVGSSSAAN